MICLSLANATVEEAKEFMSKFDLVELRLDKLQWDVSQLQELLGQAKNCILTCRKTDTMKEDQRKALLVAGIKLSPEYLDLDMENDLKFSSEMISLSKIQGLKLIISYHNYTHTPPLPVLKKYIEQHFFMGANISKIACQCSNEEELSRIFSLYYHHDNLLALGMGEKGKISRLAALDLGAPFSYVCLEKDQTAPGQLSVDNFNQIRKTLDD